ncbi:unnamed protein product [Bursaphelenchus okinawaensis]|uniref:Uncharacterized protein n=1 Tax=Bursaphelenchus okinawaensis TaxID=465554 RepID=A0A811L0Q6_9BILA|nr:unnamed protein product [Bursaphelenchus okinawaensis]CAG9114653.1 unnamed protein product [Bursaphelenchus okinawaensis]
MVYGTTRERGLPRYDSFTLQPIRPPIYGGTVSGTLKHYNRRPLHTDVYSQPRPSAVRPITLEHFDRPVNGTVRSVNPYSSFEPAVSPPVTVTALPTVQHAFKWNWTERLAENTYIGIHRYFFLAKKLLALAALAITVYVFFGRFSHPIRKSIDEPDQTFLITMAERNLHTILFAASVFTILGNIIGSINHWNDPQKALTQLWIRLAILGFEVILDITVIVFAVAAIIKVSQESKEEETPDLTLFFSQNQRFTQLGIEIGLAITSLLFSFFSIYNGIYAIMRLLRDKNAELNIYRLNIEQASYANQLVPASDAY